MILDIHSHILPGIDDGSKNVNESVILLEMMKKQEIDAVVATPHFYGDKSNITIFLEQRKNAYEELMKSYNFDIMPQLFLGAEVRYFRGITKSDALDSLTLGNSPYILLEPPFSPFSQYMIDEIQYFSQNSRLVPIIAHVERYLHFDNWHNIVKLFSTGGIKSQINAGSLLKFSTKKKTMRFLSEGISQYIASDAHNLDKRKPCLGQGYKLVENKMDKDILTMLNRESKKLYEQL